MNRLALWVMLILSPASAQTPAENPTAAASVSSVTSVPAATPAPGSINSSKIRLDAGDAVGALADAQLVVASGGGADAFAARADAKRALGSPYEEVLADYAQAAKLDPRYIEKYNGLIAQRESERNPKKAKGQTGLNGVPVGFLAAAGIVGVFLIVAAVLAARRGGAQAAAPDDEAVKTGGKAESPKKDAPDDPNKPHADIS
jgi:hypothetical protein